MIAYIKQRIAAFTRNKARICDLLKWKHDEYHMNIYNTGLEYLRHYFGRDAEAAHQVSARQEFWNWFINLFNARDEAFIDEWDGLEDSITADDLLAIYMDIHKPAMLACEIKPPSVVYGNDFTHLKIAE